MKRELATVLNFVIWGAGYLYSGNRTVLGGFLIAGYIPMHWYWLVEIGMTSALSGISLIVFVGHLLLSAGLAYDVYTQ